MDAALHPDNGNCSHLSDDELSGMADGRGLREARNFGVRNFRSASKFIGKRA